MDHYKPGLVLLYAQPVPGSDILALLGGAPAFARVWADYEKAGQVTLDMNEYFTGTAFSRQPPVVYDMYIRK